MSGLVSGTLLKKAGELVVRVGEHCTSTGGWTGQVKLIFLGIFGELTVTLLIGLGL